MAESGQRRRSARLLARSQQTTGEEYEAVFDNYLEQAAGPLPEHGSRKRGRKVRMRSFDEAPEDNSMKSMEGEQNQAHENHLSNDRESALCQKDVSGQISAESTASQMPDKRLLNHVIDILKKRDADGIFAEPVDPMEVEGYYDFVKEPMDFSTLKEKLEQGLYSSVEHFEHDVFLIFDNAERFNGAGTVFYKQARSMRILAKKVFHFLRADPENLESKYSQLQKTPGRKPERGARSSDSAAPHELNETRESEQFEVGARSTYRPWESYQNDSLIPEFAYCPKPLVPVNFREDLLQSFMSQPGPGILTSLFYEASRGMIPAPPSQLNPEPVLNNPEVNKFMENDSFLALMMGPASNLDRTYFDEPEIQKENPVDQPSDDEP